MTIRDAAPLAPLTTFRLGGPARALAVAESDDDIRAALAHARDRGLPIRVLGGGSNVLVPDEGLDALVIHPAMADIAIVDESDAALLIAGAGARWDAVVDAAIERGLWGIENLAGIPGTIGGAAVQNIGAYGTEFSSTFAWAETISTESLLLERVTDGAFAYRTSAFKSDRTRIITRVALRLSKTGVPNVSYSDLVRAKESGVSLETPQDIAHAVRVIRAAKFPGPREEGTAGSFFKNPVLSREAALALAARYDGLPIFTLPNGMAKVPLAWILDHALSLKGYAKGGARLYEKQPLVIVAEDGAHAADVDALANDVAARVFDATGIALEREVETFIA